MKMEQTECSELTANNTYEYGTECSGTLTCKIQMHGNHPKERIQKVMTSLV